MMKTSLETLCRELVIPLSVARSLSDFPTLSPYCGTPISRETLPRQRARSINTVTTEELLEPDPDATALYRTVQASRTPQALIETSEASEATPVPARPTAVGNTAHKRQISEAIASDERPHAPGEEQEHPEAEAQGAGLQGGRKSGRAPQAQVAQLADK
jgi:hypothetical protein